MNATRLGLLAAGTPARRRDLPSSRGECSMGSTTFVWKSAPCGFRAGPSGCAATESRCSPICTLRGMVGPARPAGGRDGARRVARFVALVGDYVNLWQLTSPAWVGDTLAPLLLMDGAVAAVPGNHDYQGGDPNLLAPIFRELNIRLLRNESWARDGVTWVGVDSAVEHQARPREAMRGVQGPAVCFWHEPDLVAELPPGCSLMLSGHSHGGQGRLFGRFKPVKTKMGSQYVDGFFPDAPTPLYVSRGVGTTLFPLRIDVPPEVSLLTLEPL